jgi:DNA primase small subunit
MLIDEFGIHEESIHIYFSGNEGFHLYVTDSSFLSLDAQARSDMSGYILGRALMPETIGVYRRIRRVDGNKRSSTIDNTEGIFDRTVYGPSFRDTSPNSFNKENNEKDFFIRLSRSSLKYGWRKRLLQKLGMKNFSEIRLSNIVQQNGGYLGFKTELDKIGKELGINIDPQVTMDIHRIFRMPGTLNSKSGLAKMKCSDLKSFNPLSDACLVGGELIKIRANAAVKFTLKEREFHVEKNITFLPAYAAIYLVCKRLATVV